MQMKALLDYEKNLEEANIYIDKENDKYLGVIYTNDINRFKFFWK